MMPYTVRPVAPDDHALLRAMAVKCPPLDVHTAYTYWVLANYSADCCFLLYDGDSPVGYITGVSNRERGFIWQIGVTEGYRGKGLSALLIDALIRAFQAQGLRKADVTIEKSNRASYGAFSGYCAAHGFELRATGVSVVEENDGTHEEIRYTIFF